MSQVATEVLGVDDAALLGILERLLGQARYPSVRLEFNPTTPWAQCSRGTISMHPDLLREAPEVLAAAVAHEVAHIRYRHARLADQVRFTFAAVTLLIALAVLSGYGLVASLLLVVAAWLAMLFLAPVGQRLCETHADWAAALLLSKAGIASGRAAMALSLERGSQVRVVPPVSASVASLELTTNWRSRGALLLRAVQAEHPPISRRIARLRSASACRGLLGALHDALVTPVTVVQHGFSSRR